MKATVDRHFVQNRTKIRCENDHFLSAGVATVTGIRCCTVDHNDDNLCN